MLKLSHNRHIKHYVIRQDSKLRESSQVEICLSTTILHVQYTRDNKRSKKCVFTKMFFKKNTAMFQIKRFQKVNRDKQQNIGEKTERESDVLFPHVNNVNNDDKCIKFAGGSEWP